MPPKQNATIYNNDVRVLRKSRKNKHMQHENKTSDVLYIPGTLHISPGVTRTRNLDDTKTIGRSYYSIIIEELKGINQDRLNNANLPPGVSDVATGISTHKGRAIHGN